MSRIIMAATAIVMTAGTISPVAAQPAGTVEVCRPPGIVSITDGRPIALPSGFQFSDTGDARERDASGSGYRFVRLALQQPLTIAANARCATGRAVVTTNPSGFPITPREHRTYRPGGAFSGPMPEIVAIVAAEFR
jgi:hypothetical protein